MPTTSRSRNARVTVPRETLNCFMISASLGRRSPGRSLPSSMRRRKRSRICAWRGVSAVTVTPQRYTSAAAFANVVPAAASLRPGGMGSMLDGAAVARSLACGGGTPLSPRPFQSPCRRESMHFLRTKSGGAAVAAVMPSAADPPGTALLMEVGGTSNGTGFYPIDGVPTFISRQRSDSSTVPTSLNDTTLSYGTQDAKPALPRASPAPSASAVGVFRLSLRDGRRIAAAAVSLVSCPCESAAATSPTPPRPG